MSTPAKIDRFNQLARELRLTEKQRIFAEVLAETGNQSEAARRIGVTKDVAISASKMVRGRKVSTYLAALKREALSKAEQRTGRAIMGASEVLERLSEQAEADLSDFITIVEDKPEPPKEGEEPKPPTRHWFIDIPKAIAAGKGHLIQEIGFDSNGLPKLKFPDRQGALDKLAKYHGHYGDKDSAGPVTVNVTLQQVLREDPRLAVEMTKALLSGGPKVVGGG